MLDIIAEFLFDAIGDLFESGAEATAEAAAGAATDIGVDAALGTGVDVLDPGAALAPPVDAAAGRRWHAVRVRQPPDLCHAPVGRDLRAGVGRLDPPCQGPGRCRRRW